MISAFFGQIVTEVGKSTRQCKFLLVREGRTRMVGEIELSTGSGYA